MPKNVIVIGSGFSGLAAAASLAQDNYKVTILEKNDSPGGRARQFKAAGFTFDMGPSWYWMPEVFEAFFNRFDKSVKDYYDLVRLDPSYTVFFKENEKIDVPAKLDELYALFESVEPGSSPKLKKFLSEAEYKYRVGMDEFVFKPGHSIREFADPRVFKSIFKLQMFQSMSSHVRNLFKNDKLIQLLEFPVLFLGATPWKTPAMYSLMNYADLVLGTWYPKGGMFKIIEAMVALAKAQGVTIKYGEEVKQIFVPNGHATEVITTNNKYQADIVVASSDYHHTDQDLLAPSKRMYSPKYWNTRTMAPSSLLFYLGVNKKLSGLHHHNLFFDEDFNRHAREIYESPQWPENPLFYVCCPSQTDDSVAPKGMENLFVLIPLAPGLEDSEKMRERYFDIVMNRLEKRINQKIKDHLIYKRSFAMNDFKEDYHAFKGNAYGLANTIMQTAFLKPKLRSKKVKNLFFTGQLTTPGPGVPPSLISGQVVANEIRKIYKSP